MSNFPISLCAILVILAIIIFFYSYRENFSNNTLVLTNDECRRLTGYFYRPEETDPVKRLEYENKFCGDSEIIYFNEPQSFSRQWLSVQ